MKAAKRRPSTAAPWSGVVVPSLLLGCLIGAGCGDAGIMAAPDNGNNGGRSGAGGAGGGKGGTGAPDGGFIFTPPDGGAGETGPYAGEDECGKLKVTVRDFRSDHPDFEKPALANGLFKGLVKPTLGADGLPEYLPTGPTIVTSGKAGFDQWYRDVPGVNMRFEVTLLLTRTASGSFVYDNPQFFPIDGMGWPNDDRLGHNFGFTTEIHATFKYKGGEKFIFTGDDDVFVFVNRQLVIDLGGVHGAESETVDFDAQASALGIEVGKSYTFDVFQAERHTSKSTFRMETTIECLKVIIM